MSLRQLQPPEIRAFTGEDGQVRDLAAPDDPPTARQLVALWHEGAIALVHPDNEQHVFTRAQAAGAIAWLRGNG